MANLLSFFIFNLLILSSYSADYFINCGSDSSISVPGGTIFSGDIFTGSGDSETLKDPNSNGSESIYQTARIFKQISSYELDTEEEEEKNGVYMVKLHFYPFVFSTQDNLFNAKFDILANGYLLLSNFSVPKNKNLPVVKEFLVPLLQSSKLKITFRPSNLAFVSAIEAFITPQSFIPGSADHVTFQESSKIGDTRLSSNALTVIHRINVGGSRITPENDTMRRNWFPDDDYLFFKDSAKNVSHSESLNYVPESNGGANTSDAPNNVYSTAKEMNIDEERKANFFNITWLFGVKKNTAFFVRLHFCDIVSVTRNGTVFNLYIYGLFSKPISPFDIMDRALVAPFYVDFVVDSDGSGFMNISVGPRLDSQEKNAFLNGVEIMELIDERESVPDGNGSSKKKRLLIIVGAVVGGVVGLFLVSVGVIWLCLKSRKEQSVKKVDLPVVNVYGGSSHTRTTELTSRGSNTADMNLRLKIPLAEILNATKNFDHRLMIGEGGFGKVYKGTLHDGIKVAVKRSEQGRDQGLEEFQNEIMVLSKIRHRHLVSLIGYCDERDEMILVYEFMEKGTLREHLYSSNEDIGKSSSRSELSWDQRLKICIGAARGLDYLHKDLTGSIVHRDIKSTNILLDECYVAKVADFGLSKLGLAGETDFCTDHVKGTFGYLDPEYFTCLELTQKSDVYSFGVVLLEVLCARPAIDKQLPRDQANLAEWGISWQRQNQLDKIIDPFLAGKINPNSLRKFGEIVEKCLKESGTDRPEMLDVLWDLEFALKLQQSAMSQEPYEDSTTGVSLVLPDVHRLPSFAENTTYVSDTEVFSQLRMGDAR